MLTKKLLVVLPACLVDSASYYERSNYLFTSEL